MKIKVTLPWNKNKIVGDTYDSVSDEVSREVYVYTHESGIYLERDGEQRSESLEEDATDTAVIVCDCGNEMKWNKESTRCKCGIEVPESIRKEL